jgi:hypothetical protein
MADAVEAVVVFVMRLGAPTFWTAVACIVALVPVSASAEEGFDTEHIFGFMIGSDVGNQGEREFQTQTTGRFGKGGGTYRALGQEVEIEIVPLPNFRVEVGATGTLHDITGVPDIDDRRQFNFQGLSLDLRYRLLDREKAPFGMTIAAETHGDRIDEVSGAKGRMYGTDFTLAFDRELIPNFLIGALNLIYQPEWTRFEVSGLSEKSSTIGAAFAGMVRVSPNLLLGGEMRYFRQYEGIGLGEFSGQALFVGPAGSGANLDLVNFERHQARLVFGINF